MLVGCQEQAIRPVLLGLRPVFNYSVSLQSSCVADVSGSADSGISSSSSVATVTSDKLLLRTGSAAAAGSRQRIVDDGNDDETLTLSSVHNWHHTQSCCTCTLFA